MVKRVRFPLDMGNDIMVRSIEELKKNYNADRVAEYFLNGKLLTWLEDRHCDTEAEQVKKLSQMIDKNKAAALLPEIFEVEITKNVDIKTLEVRREKLEKLRTITSDDEILDNVDSVAFSQEDLGDLLDEAKKNEEKKKIIYLCGDKFRIPLSVKNVKYIGVNNPAVIIGDNGEVELKESGISFENCKLPAEINGEDASENAEDDEYADIPYTDEKYFRLETKNDIVRLKKYVGKDAIVKIPKGINLICDSAFQGNTFIEQVILPKSLKKIGNAAFHLCENLEIINIPNGVEIIGTYAFYNCNLKNISISNSIKKIDSRAFMDCKYLLNVNFPYSLTEIGERAFSGCNNLTSIILPESITTIEDGLFSDCESLKEIKLPNGITKIGDCAFAGCKRLKTINIPDTVTEIGKLAFFQCESLTHIYLPDSVTKITENTFEMFSNLKVTYRGETFSNQQLSFVLKSEVEKPGSTKDWFCRDTFPKFK